MRKYWIWREMVIAYTFVVMVTLSGCATTEPQKPQKDPDNLQLETINFIFAEPEIVWPTTKRLGGYSKPETEIWSYAASGGVERRAISINEKTTIRIIISLYETYDECDVSVYQGSVPFSFNAPSPVCAGKSGRAGNVDYGIIADSYKALDCALINPNTYTIATNCPDQSKPYTILIMNLGIEDK